MKVYETFIWCPGYLFSTLPHIRPCVQYMNFISRKVIYSLIKWILYFFKVWKKNSHSHGHCSSVVTEAAIQRYSPKKLLLKISLISQENECNWLWHWSFPVNFAQFLRTNIFRERLWWLLLSLLLTLNSYVNENVPPCASIFDYLLVYDMAITWLSRNHFLVKDPSIVNRAIFRIS